MIYYNAADFLEYFDSEKVFDEESGLLEYTIKSEEKIALIIYLNVYEGTVCCSLLSPKGIVLVDFAMHRITSISCDKNKPGFIRFLFFKNEKIDPMLIVMIKPSIELSFDLG